MLLLSPRPPPGVSAPRTSDVRIRISDAYLARVVARRMEGIQLPSVGNVRVASNPPGSLIVRSDLSLGPLSAPAVVELAPFIENGHVQIRLISTDVGNIPVPPQLTQSMADAVNRRIAELPGGGGRATGVQVFPSGLEVLATYP